MRVRWLPWYQMSLFVKPSESGRTFIGDPERHPYPGAKNWFYILKEMGGCKLVAKTDPCYSPELLYRSIKSQETNTVVITNNIYVTLVCQIPNFWQEALQPLFDAVSLCYLCLCRRYCSQCVLPHERLVCTGP
jgi:hypothetical protein